MLGKLVAKLFLLGTFLGVVICQEGIRDDRHVENVVRQAVADEFSSEILTNRTRAYLSCASGEMVVKLNFSEPFRGVTYTDYDRTSPCRFYGDGSRYYELRIPLKGCGTRQEAPRVFINNIIVRFHRSLELEEDEIKTIICRYPPPLAPPPPNIAPALPPTAAVPAIIPPKLSEVELLLIICALLFLTLLLLGIGIAYYCLKKRNIKVIKKRKAISSGPGSEITKLSGSTMGTLSMFDPIRIPRAIAQSTSGSEAALLTSLSSQNGSGDHSDTIPSDYPSESPSSVNSDVEEIEQGRRMMINDLSTMRGDHFRYENTAFIPDDTASSLSGYPEDQEKAHSVSSIPIQQILKPMEPPKKKLRTKTAREHVLTTITEREDAMLQREALQKTYAAMRTIPELNPPVSYTKTYTREAPPKPPSSYAPSLYGSIPDNDDRSQAEFLEEAPMAVARPPSSYAPSLKGSIPDNDIWSHSEVESEVAVIPYVRKPKRETATVTDYFLSTQKTTDIEDDIKQLRKTTTLHHKPITPPPPPTPPAEPPSDVEVYEPYVSKALVPRKPKITIQNIDDVYLTTTTEVQATETVTKTSKDTIAQHVKVPTEVPLSPSSPPTNWDVTIRHYPSQLPPDYEVKDDKLSERRWETYSEASEKFRDAESTTTEVHTQHRPRHPSEPSRAPTPMSAQSSPNNTMHKVMKTIPHPTYTSIIFKVLEPPPVEGIEHLTPAIKEKWRTIITTDETFRYLVQEATTVEEYIRITKDSRYERLFDTRTWHVIIRALSCPDDRYPPIDDEPSSDARNPRYKKRSDIDPPRNRRSSLPPVTEFSLARDAPPSSCGSIRSRRTSRSGSVPEYDLRSMTEVDVDFAHADRESLWSVDTGYTYKTSKSLAERSMSEFLEDVPTIVADRSPHYRGAQQQSYYVEQSAAEFVRSHDSYLRESQRMEFGEEDFLHQDPLPAPQKKSRPPFLERSSAEYFEDVPSLSLPDLRQASTTETTSIRERRMDNVVRELRHNGKFSRSRTDAEVIIDSPIVRAIDKTSTSSINEEIKSVTEKNVIDWKR